MSLQKLGRYDIVKPIGSWKLGLVYEAHDPNIVRHVAVKTIRVDDLPEGQAAIYEARFRAETWAGSRLLHPNIVGVHDAGRDQGLLFLVMELVLGGDLRQHLGGNKRLGFEQAMVVMRDLLSALSFAHDLSVLHRSVRPEAIRIDASGRAKVEFGVAETADHSAAQRIAKDPLIAEAGAAGYLSPEQLSGQQVDARTDLYSAGAVLYAMLTGAPPFSGSGEAGALRAMAPQVPPPPSVASPGLPSGIDDIVAKALATDRDQRYPSAREFALALEAVMRRVVGRDSGAEAVKPGVGIGDGDASAPSKGRARDASTHEGAEEEVRRRAEEARRHTDEATQTLEAQQKKQVEVAAAEANRVALAALRAEEARRVRVAQQAATERARLADQERLAQQAHEAEVARKAELDRLDREAREAEERLVAEHARLVVEQRRAAEALAEEQTRQAQAEREAARTREAARVRLATLEEEAARRLEELRLQAEKASIAEEAARTVLLPRRAPPAAAAARAERPPAEGSPARAEFRHRGIEPPWDSATGSAASETTVSGTGGSGERDDDETLIQPRPRQIRSGEDAERSLPGAEPRATGTLPGADGRAAAPLNLSSDEVAEIEATARVTVLPTDGRRQARSPSGKRGLIAAAAAVFVLAAAGGLWRSMGEGSRPPTAATSQKSGPAPTTVPESTVALVEAASPHADPAAAAAAATAPVPPLAEAVASSSPVPVALRPLPTPATEPAKLPEPSPPKTPSDVTLTAPLANTGPSMEWARGRETSAGLVEAIAAYKQVSKAAGTADAARAARRLWEIYRDGGSGVTSNNALAQQWYERAQILGAVLPASPASKAAATGKVPPPPDRATAKTRPPSISDPSKGSPSLEWARSLERTDLLVAVPVYQNIADAGTPTDGAKAARRLWEIYRDGGSGMAADPAKARQWYERAQGLGASMPAWTAPGATR